MAIVHDDNHTTVFDFGGMKPVSPNDRRITWPFGLIVS